MIIECPGCHSRYDVTGRPPGTRARCRCGAVFVLPEPSSSASMLNCPGCGAGVSPTARRCDYCSAELLLKACPRCFARIFHGSKHCRECGAKVEVPATANPDGSAAPLLCARCIEPTPMVARLVGDVLLDECPECHGVWLDICQLDKLVEERRGTSTEAVLSMGSANRPVEGSDQVKGRVYVKCPDCETVMNRVNFGRRSGVIVDVCRAHGTWFDADELPKVVSFIMRGGIEEMHRRDLEELKAEQKRARGSAVIPVQRPVDMLNAQRADQVGVFGSLLGVIGRILID